MKKTILMLAILCSYFAAAQGENFEFNEVIPGEKKSEYVNITGSYVVLNVEGSVSELYQMTRDWVNETYNNPEEVIISDTDSKYLKIRGAKDSMYSYKVMGMMFGFDGKYRLDFKFKENKIKMEILSAEIYYAPSKYSSGGWSDLDRLQVVKNNGKPNQSEVGKVEGIKSTFNNLAMSLANHKANQNAASEDW